jgi:regulatory protein YycH of two-component signal transduction system YycFG
MNMIYKKQGIGIALGIFVFAVSMVLMSGDGLFVSKVSAQGVNSTAAPEPTDKMDQVIAKFKEIVNQNGINTTALTIPNNLDISQELPKVVAAKVIPAVSDALNQALDQAGIKNATQGLKEKYAGDLPALVQKFNELRQNSTG